MEYTNFRKINLPVKEYSKEIIIFYFSWDNSLKRKKECFCNGKYWNKNFQRSLFSRDPEYNTEIFIETGIK